jgi:hypothetical protein
VQAGAVEEKLGTFDPIARRGCCVVAYCNEDGDRTRTFRSEYLSAFLQYSRLHGGVPGDLRALHRCGSGTVASCERCIGVTQASVHPEVNKGAAAGLGARIAGVHLSSG